MAINVNVDTGNFTWTVKSAQEATTGTRLNVGNMMLSYGAILTKDYGDRIKTQLSAVEQDIEDLKDYQTYKTYVEGWNTRNWLDIDHLTPGKGYSPSHIFDALGVDVTSYTREAQLNRPIEAYYFYKHTTTGDSYTDWRSYPPISIPENFSQVTATGPASTIRPDNINLVYESADGKLFIRGPDGAWPVNDVRVVLRPPLDEQLEELRDLALTALKDKTEQATQVSQSKQAFLQDLIAKMNNFFSWTTNTGERLHRDKQSIIDRF